MSSVRRLLGFAGDLVFWKRDFFRRTCFKGSESD
jgi:hypothetical protein